jgi:excisionase family DNA binding protein
MARDDDTPLTFTVQEVAHALGVSDDTILRQIHDGTLSAIRVGRRMLPLRQPLVEIIARTLAANDPRRIEQACTDQLIADDAQARRDEDAAQADERAWRKTPEGQRAVAAEQDEIHRQHLIKAGMDVPEDHSGTRESRVTRLRLVGDDVRREHLGDYDAHVTRERLA